jgi:hypothetical protein
MNLESQVVSLDLAKRLKELGVKQDSTFDWVLGDKPDFYLWLMPPFNRENLKGWKEQYSAFTVAELGEMLPIWHDSCKREENDWHVRVFEKHKDNICHNSFDPTEANARAKMLIYLIENKLYEPK